MVGFKRFDEKNGKNACYQGFFGLWGKKEHPTGLYQILSDVMAGAEGLEPSTKVLETHVLPLHHAPTFFRTKVIIPHFHTLVNRKNGTTTRKFVSVYSKFPGHKFNDFLFPAVAVCYVFLQRADSPVCE